MFATESTWPSPRFYWYRGIAIAGCLLLFIGSFSPAISAGAHVSYFGGGHGDGVLTAICAVYCTVLVLALKRWWASAWGLLTVPVVISD
jgi:hypothetical protein